MKTILIVAPSLQKPPKRKRRKPGKLSKSTVQMMRLLGKLGGRKFKDGRTRPKPKIDREKLSKAMAELGRRGGYAKAAKTTFEERQRHGYLAAIGCLARTAATGYDTEYQPPRHLRKKQWRQVTHSRRRE